MNTNNSDTAVLDFEDIVTDLQVENSTQSETVVENEVANTTETKVDGRTFNAGRKPKVYAIHTNNQPYLAYLATLGENTQYQYGLTIKNFLQSLGQKTPKNITAEELDNFVGASTVKRVHIRGFFGWTFETNVNNIKADIRKEVLFWLL